MRTTWEYSPETEAKRLLHCAHQIATGFYKANNFLVLPSHAKKSEVISLPDLLYLSIPRFWDHSSRIDVNALPLNVSKSLLNSTVKLLASTTLPQVNYFKIKKLWEKHQDQIINKIYEVIPSKRNSISQITVMPTAFGTSCSFSIPKKFPTHIHIWLREDQGISSMVEAILTSLTRNDVYEKLGGVWRESEIIVDWLMAYSSLSIVLKKVDPQYLDMLTIKNTRVKQNGKLVEESNNFLSKIGAPTTNKIFGLNGTVPLVRNNPIQNLTHREKSLLTLLISRRPKITTIDEIADLLFAQNEDAFSLEAIAKSIQRLRDKLEANSVSGSFIQTKRGEGYLLVN